MRNVLIMSSILMMSFAVLAQEVETCANGAGTVITGAVTGHKYCKSNNRMDWWNAHAWCDALGRRLFSLEDCPYSVTGTTACADLVGVGGGMDYIWTATSAGTDGAYIVGLASGGVLKSLYNRNGTLYYSLCY